MEILAPSLPCPWHPACYLTANVAWTVRTSRSCLAQRSPTRTTVTHVPIAKVTGHHRKPIQRPQTTHGGLLPLCWTLDTSPCRPCKPWRSSPLQERRGGEIGGGHCDHHLIASCASRPESTTGPHPVQSGHIPPSKSISLCPLFWKTDNSYDVIAVWSLLLHLFSALPYTVPRPESQQARTLLRAAECWESLQHTSCVHSLEVTRHSNLLSLGFLVCKMEK